MLRPRFSLRTLIVLVMIIGGVAVASFSFRQTTDVATLNSLRDEVNASYGFKDGTPRINCGPCIRFAIAFRDRWNARFPAKVQFACLLMPPLCGHVAIKLPNGDFFDGGHGVMSERKLTAMYSDCVLQEMPDLDMTMFGERDVQLLSVPIGGQNPDHYLECPNYSDDLTAKLIDKYLADVEK